MKYKVTYPTPKKKLILKIEWRWTILALLWAGAISTGIINLAVGGDPWSLVVIGGEYLFYRVFLRQPLVENSQIGKLTDAILSTCLYLILIDVIYGDGWSVSVVPILTFSLLIIQGLVFFLFYRRQRKNFMPLYWVTIGGLVAIISALIGFPKINWPIIVTGSLAFLILIISVIALRKPIWTELKKKFHTK
ncbi:MAG: hypothetical protein EOM74_04760 [Methanomicrobia archaeon]|nr:hypothetical protein [Methanomicrobia archaeon]